MRDTVITVNVKGFENRLSWRICRYSSNETENYEYLRLDSHTVTKWIQCLPNTNRLYCLGAKLIGAPDGSSKTVHCSNTYIRVGWVFSLFREYNSDINFNFN